MIGAVRTLEKHGAIPENIHVKTVPGSFELVYGASPDDANGGYDAIIILGSVLGAKLHTSTIFARE